MLNVIYDILQLIGNLLYLIYETLILGGVFILFPLEDKHTKILLHKSSIKVCNTFCKDVCFDISWKMCELVTTIQTLYRKTIMPNFHRITDNYFRNRNAVLLIKNGEEIEQFKTWHLFEQEKENIDFDLILYTKYNENEPKKNYTLIRDKLPSSFCSPPDSLLNNKCDVSFIVFQLINIDGNKYDIQLKENRNFLVKDNVLKYAFFKWYMKQVYDVILSEDFSVNYMTNDMSMATLHNPFFIKFNEDGVTSFSAGKPKIVSKEKETEKEEEEEEETEEEEEEGDSDESEALLNDETKTVVDTDINTDVNTDVDTIKYLQPSADTVDIEMARPDIMISEQFKHHIE